MDAVFFRNIDDLFSRFTHNIGTWLSDHGLSIFTILIIAWLIHRFGSQILARILESTARPDLYPTKSDRAKRLRTLENLAGDILKVGVYVVAGIMIVSEFGVDTTPLVASAGALGLILGIGAQSLVRDVTSGIFIIINNQFRVGDDVEVRVGGAMAIIGGTVEDIGIRSTSLRDLNGSLHHIANGNIMVVSNQTIGFNRINLDILFPIDVDIEKVKLLIDRVGSDLTKDPLFEKKIKEAPHFVRVSGLESDGIRIKIFGKTGSTSGHDIEGEFYKRLIKELRKAKIQLAKKT